MRMAGVCDVKVTDPVEETTTTLQSPTTSIEVDGKWSPWGSYGVCGTNGKKQRTRSCTNPAPLNGGKQCSGSSKDEVSCAGCPDGWKEFNQACYRYGDSAKTWEDAESVCQGQTWQGVQGHLASVHSEEENIFVASLAEETIWLCPHDLHQEGQWTWTDGTEFSYSNWAKGEPNNHGNNEDCMEIASPTSEEKQWNDDVCTKQAKFVCKLSRELNNGDVRLTSYPSGRVEIWKDGKWGTLCGHYWWDNQKGAENICKQLGYTGGTKYTDGGGTGPIHAGNRLCSGGEETIFDCPLQAGRSDTTGCSHSLDQGVQCTGGDVCPEGWTRKDKKCYKFFDINTSWEKAQATCQKNGANLVSIEDQ